MEYYKAMCNRVISRLNEENEIIDLTSDEENEIVNFTLDDENEIVDLTVDDEIDS